MQGPQRETNSILSQHRDFPLFIVPKYPLLSSQKHAIGPNLKPDELKLHPPTLLS